MSIQREESTAAGILGFVGKIIVYVIVGFLLVQGVTKGYAFGYEVFCPSAVEAAPGRDKTIEIAEGLTISETADVLIKKGLIKNKATFIIQAKFYEYEVHSGTYRLNTSMTSRDILEVLNEIPDGENGKEDAGE